MADDGDGVEKGEGRLWLVKGSRAYELPSPDTEEQMTIGRSRHSYLIIHKDDCVSNWHFRVRNGMIEDMKSTHGTFLNGQLLTKPQKLKENDVVKVGNSKLFVRTKENLLSSERMKKISWRRDVRYLKKSRKHPNIHSASNHHEARVKRCRFEAGAEEVVNDENDTERRGEDEDQCRCDCSVSRRD